MDVLLSEQLLVSALVLASLYGLVALGLNLVYGTMRLLNVAHGEIVMIGGYVAYWGFSRFGVSPLLSMPVAALIGALLGGVVYVALFRRMLRESRLSVRIEANSLLIFFGISIILQNVTALAFTADQRGYAYLDRVVHVADVSVEENRLIILAIGAGICLCCAVFFRYTRAGSAMRAIIQQRDAASLVGIDVERVNMQVFVLGFALAALAGTLISMTQQISPFVGFPFTISAFVIIIMGGLGNLLGSLVAAVILAFVEVYGVAIVSASFRSILVYGVFIAVLLLRPQGLFGRSIAVR